MKKIIFLLMLTNDVIAQPGDIPKLRADRIDTITNLLQKKPDDLLLRWERINLIFDPYFEMYTVPMQYGSVDTILSYGNKVNLSFKKINILTEINKLINEDVSIVELGGRTSGIDDTISITPSSLYLKRGQYYYLKNSKQKALEDFLKALSYNPPKTLKERICISLAAYYYNNKEGSDNENLEKALQYIDMATPIIYESQPRVLNSYSERYEDLYEKEKIILLNATNKKERLINYLKNLSLSYLNLYLEEMAQSAEYKKGHSYSIPATLKRGLDYFSMLSDYNYNSKTFDSENKIRQIVKGIILQLSE